MTGNRGIGLICLLALAHFPLIAAEEAGQRLAARAFSDTPIFEDLKELCDRIGGRPTGSPASSRAIQWAVAKFEKAGFSSVTIEPFQIPNLWLPGTAEGSAVSPEPFSVRLAAAPFTPPTEGVLEAPMVDAGEGSPAEFSALGQKARGAILLVHSKEMKTFDDLFAE